MDPREASRLPWLPATRKPVPPPAVPDPAPSDPPPPPGPRFGWRRLTRSRRGAAGLVIAVAALLLWPFADWPAIPWLAGIGLLLLLRLLRLDGLLRGWAPHLGGLAVVGGLTMSTGPWAWALAASIGVLLAGLVQLPWWRLAAVGAVLCLVTGVGYGFSTYRSAELQREIQAHAGDALRIQLGEARPARVLPAMVQAIRLDDADPICRLLSPAAEAAVLAATAAPNCAEAVAELHRRLPAGSATDDDKFPQPVVAAGGWQVDACPTEWAAATGPSLGKVLIFQTEPTVQRFAISGFAPCAPGSVGP